MKLSQFITRIKIQAPNISGIDDDAITDLINKGCDQVNLLTKVYRGYTDFNIVANQQIYNFSSVVPSYLGIDKKSVYFLDSSSEWQDLIPKSKDWISKNYPDWINSTAVALPQWYWIEADEIGFYPKPSTSTTAGCRIYHLKKATAMGSVDHYPFTGNSTEITALIPLDDAIVAYVKWKLSPAVGAVTDADLRKNEFLEECRKGAMQINRRQDMSIDPTFRINI